MSGEEVMGMTVVVGVSRASQSRQSRGRKNSLHCEVSGLNVHGDVECKKRMPAERVKR